jgi:hypothetical protein
LAEAAARLGSLIPAEQCSFSGTATVFLLKTTTLKDWMHEIRRCAMI